MRSDACRHSARDKYVAVAGVRVGIYDDDRLRGRVTDVPALVGAVLALQLRF